MTDITHSISQNITQIVYLVSALLFIFGLKKMTSTLTARKGLTYTVVGLVIAVLITFFHHQVNSNFLWMTIAMIVGAALAFYLSTGVKSTETPKMIALFTGLGGGTAAAIAAVELIKMGFPVETKPTDTAKVLAVSGALLGSVCFSSSLVTFAKLNGSIKGTINFPMQQWVNTFILVIAVTFGAAIVLNNYQLEVTQLILFFVLALLFGILLTIPMNQADMPIFIPLLNVFSGLAIGFVGYVLLNPAMMIAGLLVAAAGLKLTLSFAKSMNRSIPAVLFGTGSLINQQSSGGSINSNKAARELQSDDAAMMMAFAQNIIIIPGYGMAAAQAQHKVWEMSKLLINNGVNVRFAVHPVAGRMPGHMDVLLAETGIPYDAIHDLNEINGEFKSADVVLLIGANDTTNTSARTDQNSPIFDMPILNADQAKNIIVIKRGKGTGFSDIDNPLFYQENTGMLYGDAESVLSKVVNELKNI